MSPQRYLQGKSIQNGNGRTNPDKQISKLTGNGRRTVAEAPDDSCSLLDFNRSAMYTFVSLSHRGEVVSRCKQDPMAMVKEDIILVCLRSRL